MTDSEREEIMSSLHQRKADVLLCEVLQWYYVEFGRGTLTGLIKRIEQHLEKKGEEEETAQDPECRDSVRS